MLTHGAGTLAAAAAAVTLVMAASKGGEPSRVISLSIFGAALVGVYGISTVYHAVRRPRLKRWLRQMDHAMIFVLIAGTYTPLMWVTLGGAWGLSLLGVVWGLAGVGVCLKLCCFGRWGWTQLGLTLVMGWLIVIAAEPMTQAMSGAGLGWLVGGGVAYTAGVVFFLWDRLRFHHAIWHGFVLAGSGCHVMMMWTDVVPRAAG